MYILYQFLLNKLPKEVCLITVNRERYVFLKEKHIALSIFMAL